MFASDISTKESGTKFVVIGHLYPIMKNDEKMSKFARKINSYNPDYIFILGDSVLENKKILDKYKNLFKSKLFFVPGEQELKKSLKSFKENVAYLIHLEEKDVRFLLLNSSSSVDDLKDEIKKFLKRF